MTNVEDLIKQRDEMDVQIKEALKNQRAADLKDVLAKCKLHGFTATEMRSAIKRKRKPKVATT
ncbi:hypothetical protein SAMN05216227_103613 [Pseudorhodobacter antarcticus]|uniref:H-NS histone family protein n=1 Tax=Pseudorhodobacter antarcticus TaxID=1077947 RepID=A0A1H8KX41_9RHOB|nr:hypothetical protein [Pseudorhodobacter antarcticus]SEN97464.1 hypothetical protein SAMN05216227_103613 [Pseudorhodobacter antarcticus]